jgi:hypothetical protein
MHTHWTSDLPIYTPDSNPGPVRDVERDNLAPRISENMNPSWQSLASDLDDSWQANPPFATSAPPQGYPLPPSSHESSIRSHFHGKSLCLKYGPNSYTQRQDTHTSLLATMNYGILVPLLSSRISSVLCQLRVEEVAPRFLVHLKVCLL